jgi:hypothetical protein
MHSPHFDMNLSVLPWWELGSCKAKRLGCTISLLQLNELEGSLVTEVTLAKVLTPQW